MRRLAIITGASRGIGRETALALAAADCDLVLAARSELALEQVAKDCRELGVAVTAMATDLTETCAASTMVQQARSISKGEHYPVLINVAGIAEFGSFDQQPLELFEKHVRLNYLAGVGACHAALPWMLEGGGGQIINVLSIAARHPFSGATAYGSSKAAMLMFTQILALEYRARGIRVTALIPGSVDTALWDKNIWKPESMDMLRPSAVAEAIRDLVLMPKDRNIDELMLMPPNGIL
jgi:short-subunit dehydrogenase